MQALAKELTLAPLTHRADARQPARNNQSSLGRPLWPAVITVIAAPESTCSGVGQPPTEAPQWIRHQPSEHQPERGTAGAKALANDLTAYEDRELMSGLLNAVRGPLAPPPSLTVYHRTDGVRPMDRGAVQPPVELSHEVTNFMQVLLNGVSDSAVPALTSDSWQNSPD